jgi:hypothetical protein
MAFDNLQTLEIIETMNIFLESIRPPESIRDQLDIGYLIEENSILIVEIRPQWNKPEIIRQTPVAKTTFVKSKNHWKVFWMRADLKWHSYTPEPFVTSLKSFTKLVQEDKHSCFFG